ncbi:hypothetical protein U1Q18_000581, partial [Sarracenia purpurea var. burkii]
QFDRPSAAELSDFGCFIVLACGVVLLQQTDISLIYHMIRGQGTIKLYVVYNVLERPDLWLYYLLTLWYSSRAGKEKLKEWRSFEFRHGRVDGGDFSRREEGVGF